MVLWRKTLRKIHVVDLGETLKQIIFSQNPMRFKIFLSKTDMFTSLVLKFYTL